MDAGARWLVWRTGLHLRHAAWQRRRRLVREIAEYRTTDERADLMAAIDRCPNPGREEVRRILVACAVRTELGHSPYRLQR